MNKIVIFTQHLLHSAQAVLKNYQKIKFLQKENYVSWN